MNPIFGEPWDAPICEGAVQVSTPVGVECMWCRVPVEEGDQGVLMGYVGIFDGKPVAQQVPYHRECLMRSTVGPPEHLDGTCTCHGGAPPSKQTPQQMRAEAIEVWNRLHRIGS